MDEEKTYLFHQTPSDIAAELIQYVPIEENDILYEPFKGEGAFYNNFPESNVKIYTEIKENLDYKDNNDIYDWVISNPHFRLETNNVRRNAFWVLVDYFTDRARKGVAFLGNDYCLSTLTPRRLNILKEKGFTVNKIVVCNIKKWRGRYFFIILEKDRPTDFYNYLLS